MKETILYKLKNGKYRSWKISVLPVSFTMEYGAFGGKQTTSKTVSSNSVKEAESKIRKKIKEGYTLTMEADKKETFECMLLHEYTPEIGLKNIRLPCYYQYKLDGVRGLYYCDKNELLSKKHEPQYNTAHILEELHGFCKGKGKGLVLDGELYSDSLPFDVISGALRSKNKKVDDSKNIEYHIFDYYDPEKPDLDYKTRLDNLSRMITGFKYIKLVKTYKVNGLKDLDNALETAIDKGYEGIVVKNISHKYQPRKRTFDCLKLKPFMDSEFEISGGRILTKGKRAGSVSWKVKTGDGTGTFNVVQKGTCEESQELAKNIKENIGKLLTVTYQSINEKTGKPRFPVGKRIRGDI